MPQDPYAAIAQPVADPYAAIATDTPLPPSLQLSNPSTVPNARIRNLPNPAEGETSPGEALYHGAKTGLLLGSLPAAAYATVPGLVTGAAGATIGSMAGKNIAKSAGAGEFGQEVASDVGGLTGGSITASAADAVASRLRNFYTTLPPEAQEAFWGIVGTRGKNAAKLANILKLGQEPPTPQPPTPEQLNPSLVSPARTLPGQISPEITRPKQEIAAPIGPRKGLALPPGPPEYPGAPLPDVPPRPVLQASSLMQGPQSITMTDPAAGLGQIPVRPGTAGSMAESVTAPKPITRAQVEQQLNDALGGRPLQPNVPLRNQGPGASKLPEGFSPIDSSALKGYKYNPDTKEFETITQQGQHYIYGEVEPEVAQKFIDADSKGSAWGKLRKEPGVVEVAKVINGKRVPFRPTAQSTAAPEGDLTSQLQQSLEQAQAAKSAPRFVFRARDIGEQGVPLSNDHAQATTDFGQALKYSEAGQRSQQPGEVVRIDLSKLKPTDYIVKTHPSGAKWVQFTRPLSENEVNVFAGKTAGQK